MLNNTNISSINASKFHLCVCMHACVCVNCCFMSASGDMHRYDGVAYPQSFKEGTFRSIVKEAFGYNTLPKQVREEAVIAGKVFLPSVAEIVETVTNASASQKGTAEDLIKRVSMTMNSLKLQMLDIKLESVDPDLAKQVMLNIFSGGNKGGSFSVYFIKLQGYNIKMFWVHNKK